MSVIACIERRYANMETDPVVSKSGVVLNCQLWPRHDSSALTDHGNSEILSLAEHFSETLKKNGCDVDKLLPEWVKLKRYIKRHWQPRFIEKGGTSLF